MNFFLHKHQNFPKNQSLMTPEVFPDVKLFSNKRPKSTSSTVSKIMSINPLIITQTEFKFETPLNLNQLLAIISKWQSMQDQIIHLQKINHKLETSLKFWKLMYFDMKNQNSKLIKTTVKDNVIINGRNDNCMMNSTEDGGVVKHERISKNNDRIKTKNLHSEDLSNKACDEESLHQVSEQNTSNNFASSAPFPARHNQQSFSTLDKISNRFKKFISSKVDHNDITYMKSKHSKKHKNVDKNDCDKNSIKSGHVSVKSEDNLKINTKPRTKSEGSTGYLGESYNQTAHMTSNFNTDTVQSLHHSLNHTPNRREAQNNNELPPPVLRNKSLSYQHLVFSDSSTNTHPSTPRNSTSTSPNKSTLILPQSQVNNDCYIINDMTTKANVTTIPKIITTNLTSINPSVVHQPTIHLSTTRSSTIQQTHLHLQPSSDHPSRRHSTNLTTLHEETSNKNIIDTKCLVINKIGLTTSLNDDFFRKPLSSPPSLKTSLSSSSSSSSSKRHSATISSDENGAMKNDENYLELGIVQKFNTALMDKYIEKKPKKAFTFFKQDKKAKQKDKKIPSKRHSLKIIRSFEGSKTSDAQPTDINHTIGNKHKNAFTPQLFKQLFDNSKTEAHDSHASNKDFVSKLSEWENLKKKNACEINRTRSACDSKKPPNLTTLLPSNQHHFFQTKNPFSPKPIKNSGFTSDLSSLKALYEAKSIENKLALQTQQAQGVRQRKISVQTLPSQQPFRLTLEYAADDNNIPITNKSFYENPCNDNHTEQNNESNKDKNVSTEKNSDGFNLLILPFMANNKSIGGKHKIRKISLESNKRIKSPRSSIGHETGDTRGNSESSHNEISRNDGECDRCKKLVVKHHNFISQNNKLVEELLKDNQSMDKDLMMKEMAIDKLEEEVKQLRTNMQNYDLRLELIYKHLNKPALGRCCCGQNINSFETITHHFLSNKLLKLIYKKLHDIPLLVQHTPMCIFDAQLHNYPPSTFCPSFYHSCEQLHNLTNSFNDFCNLLLKQLVLTQNQLLEKMKTMEKDLSNDLKINLEDFEKWMADGGKTDFEHHKDSIKQIKKENGPKYHEKYDDTKNEQNTDIHKEDEKLKPDKNKSSEMVQKNIKEIEEKTILCNMNDKERFLKCLRTIKTCYDQEVASLKVTGRMKDMVLADYERCLFVEKINNKLLIVKFVKEIKKLQRSTLRSKLEWQKEIFVDLKKMTKTDCSLNKMTITSEETKADIEKKIFIQNFIQKVEKEIGEENSKLIENNYENKVITICKENRKDAFQIDGESKKVVKSNNCEKRRTKSNKDPPTAPSNITKKHRRSGIYELENNDWSMFRCTKGTQNWKLRQAKLPYFEIEALEFDVNNYETPNERKMKQAIEAEKCLNVSEKENIKDAPGIMTSSFGDKINKNKNNHKKINKKNEKSKKKIKTIKNEKVVIKDKNMLKHLSMDSKLRRLREEKDFADEFESRDLEKIISECLQYIDDSIRDSKNKKLNIKNEQKYNNNSNKTEFIRKSLNLDNNKELLKNVSASPQKKDLVLGEKISDKRKEELRKNTKRLKEKVPESIKNNDLTKTEQQLSGMQKTTENKCNLGEQSIIKLNKSDYSHKIKPFTDNENSKNKNQCEKDNGNSSEETEKKLTNKKKNRLSICKRLCLLHHHSNEDDRLDFI